MSNTPGSVYISPESEARRLQPVFFSLWIAQILIPLFLAIPILVLTVNYVVPSSWTDAAASHLIDVATLTVLFTAAISCIPYFIGLRLLVKYRELPKTKAHNLLFSLSIVAPMLLVPALLGIPDVIIHIIEDGALFSG